MNLNPISLGIVSLGCPKNTADTETLLARIPRNFRLTNTDTAEVILINTCAFLKTAREEVYETIRKFKDKKVILVGCLTSLLKESVFEQYPQIYAVVSGAHYPDLAKILGEAAKGKKSFAVRPEPIKYLDLKGKQLITPPSYAYLKIAEGCNNFCSFCLIPYLKGRYRSRPMASILNEAKQLIGQGVKELILVAQNCGLYGIDLYQKNRLTDLLKKLNRIKGDFWIRVLYVYPEQITDELLETIAKSDKICRYLDIPLQHGDPEILKAMRRPYDAEKTLKVIEKIRSRIPDITLRTSLIAGFPGEKEKHFQNLLKFIEKIQFDHVGVFEYSREKGTKAYSLKCQAPAKTKKQRREKAMLLQQKISYNKNQSLVGQTRKVLVEYYDAGKQQYLGRLARFAPEVDGTVYLKSEKPLALNLFYDVRIAKAGPYDLYGNL